MEHRTLHTGSIYDMSRFQTAGATRRSSMFESMSSGVDYSRAGPAHLVPFHPADPNDSQWKFDTQAGNSIHSIQQRIKANNIWTNLNTGFDGITNGITENLSTNYGDLRVTPAPTLPPPTSRPTRRGVRKVKKQLTTTTATTTTRPHRQGFSPSQKVSWPSHTAKPAIPQPFVTPKSPIKAVRPPTFKTRSRKKPWVAKKKRRPGERGRPWKPGGGSKQGVQGGGRRRRRFPGPPGQPPRPRGHRKRVEGWPRPLTIPRAGEGLWFGEGPRAGPFRGLGARLLGSVLPASSRSSVSSPLYPGLVTGLVKVRHRSPHDHPLQAVVPMVTLGLALSGSLGTSRTRTRDMAGATTREERVADRAEADFKWNLHQFSSKLALM